MSCLCLPARAQVGEAPVADTLRWQDYFPLAVGNEWHYVSRSTPWPYDSTYTTYTQLLVEADTLIGEVTYYLLNGALVHYDTSSASVVERARFTDGTWREICWRGFACDLDAAFNTWNEEGWLVYREDRGPLIIAPDTIAAPKYKTFAVELAAITFSHGLGIVAEDRDADGRVFTELVYARVGEQEYGDASVILPVESNPALSSHLKSISVYPNPFHHKATIEYSLAVPAEVVVEVFDVLGRRVLAHFEGHRRVGVHKRVLDGSGLGAGAYVVRVRAGTGRSEGRVVVVQQ